MFEESGFQDGKLPLWDLSSGLLVSTSVEECLVLSMTLFILNAVSSVFKLIGSRWVLGGFELSLMPYGSTLISIELSIASL